MSLNTILATAPLTTQNYILKATGTTIGNSLIWDNGTNVGIGNQGTTYTLDVSGSLRNTTSAYFATTSGSVGIGTASPADKFSVDAGTGNIVTSSFFNSTMTAGQSTFLEFGKNYANNYNTGELAFKFVGDGSSSNMVSIGFYGAGNKLNVLGNGNVGIGTSSPFNKLTVNTGASNNLDVFDTGSAYGIGMQAVNGNNTAYKTWDFYATKFNFLNGNLFFFNYAAGTLSVNSSNQVVSSSDKNLKTDDGEIVNALNKVLKLTPRYFYWKDDSGIEDTSRQLGFYAQEVNEALGEEVANTPKDENGKWGIYDRGIIAMLTKAIQELSKQNEELSNRLIKLESK